MAAVTELWVIDLSVFERRPCGLHCLIEAGRFTGPRTSGLGHETASREKLSPNHTIYG